MPKPAFKPQPATEEKPCTLAEFVKDNGFENEQEFHKMVAKVNLANAETLRQFKDWQNNNPTKMALLEILLDSKNWD